MRIHCLGGGLVGSFVTRRLVEAGFEVHLYDVIPRQTPANFHHQSAFEADHTSADIIVNMVPGSIGHELLASLATHPYRIVDLSFAETTPDALEGCSAVILWDVGVAPGLSNMLVALAHREFGRLDNVTIKVGGNPSLPDSEWSYMAPFSPHDVIAEYTRPARVVKDSQPTVVPAMSDLHRIQANGRTMEAFLTDGLRSLIDMPVNNMGEYTVRWPGHIQRYQASTASPEELVEAWRFDPDVEEFTWMEVAVEAGEHHARWTVEDHGKDGDSSMARTTGLVTYACVKAWASNPLFERGVHPPEDLDTHTVSNVLTTLREAGVRISCDSTSANLQASS